MDILNELIITEKAKDFIESKESWVKHTPESDGLFWCWDLKSIEERVFLVATITLDGEAGITVFELKKDGWVDINKDPVSMTQIKIVATSAEHSLSISRKYLKLLNGMAKGELLLEPEYMAQIVATIDKFIKTEL